MKTKYLLVLICVFFYPVKVLVAQNSDSLFVSINKADSAFCIELVFQNLTIDTMVIPAKFKDFSSELGSGIGIDVKTYCNKVEFKLASIDDIQHEYFVLSKKRFVLIPPTSLIKFKIDVGSYFYNTSNKDEYGVSLSINYLYLRKNKEMPIWVKMTTNYIVLVAKDTIIH